MTLPVRHCKKHDRLYDRKRCPECQANLTWDIVYMTVIALSALAFFAHCVLQSARFWEMP